MMDRPQEFGAMSSAKKRDIFRAWLAGGCEYLSNSGYWLKLDPPTVENSAYLCGSKLYRVAPKEPE